MILNKNQIFLGSNFILKKFLGLQCPWKFVFISRKVPLPATGNLKEYKLEITADTLKVMVYAYLQKHFSLPFINSNGVKC